MLYRLYTDSTRYSLLGQISQLLLFLGVKSDTLRRLVNRDPGISRDKLFSSDSLFFRNVLQSLLNNSEYEKLCVQYKGVGSKCKRWGVGEADCVYGMYFENIDFLKFAKSQGLKVVVDVYEQPNTYIDIANEIRENVELKVFNSLIPLYEAKHKVRMTYINEMLDIADYYTIPSRCVENSLMSFKSFNPSRVIYLPYGSSLSTNVYKWSPIKHRLLFVGSDAVNKGLLYVAKAAAELRKLYKDLDFRVAGINPGLLDKTEPFSNLNFLGFLNKQMLMEEYCRAEALVFPSLHEGFAGCIIEAASCGCPVITTENSGADKHSFPAIFIEEKSPERIVEEVSRLFEDRERSNTVSKELYNHAKSLSIEAYKNRLTEVFKQI